MKKWYQNCRKLEKVLRKYFKKIDFCNREKNKISCNGLTYCEMWNQRITIDASRDYSKLAGQVKDFNGETI